MQYFTVTTVLTALAAVGSFATVAVASAVPARSVAFSANAPFPVSDVLTWTGPSKGVNVTLNGTSVADIANQLKALDPNWKPVTNTAKSVERGVESADMEKRQAFPNCCPVGNWNWPGGNHNDLNNAVLTVRAIGGSLGVEPNSCLQVTCVSGTGIWACNQFNDIFLEIAVSSIGDGAGEIWEFCSSNCGQIFDASNGWDTIAHGGCT